MRKKPNLLTLCSLSIFLGLLILSACNYPDQAASISMDTPMPADTSTVTPTAANTSTATPVPTSTSTATPFFTATPSLTPSPTIDPGLLGVHNRAVIIGEEGWLYLNNRPYKDICHNATNWGNFDTWVDQINTTNAFLEERGVDYVIAFIPEKCHVYTEQVRFLLHDVSGPASTIPLIEYLKNNSNAKVISFFEVLNDYKDEAQVFYKNDNHWSAVGAYLGYREMITNLMPEISTEEIVQWNYAEDYKIELREGDMGRASELEQFLYEPAVLPNHEPLLTATSLDSGDLLYENPGAENELTLVVFHDSFLAIPPIAEYLATHYQRTVYMSVNWGTHWSNNPAFLEDLIEIWEPDVIMVVSIERFLDRFLNE